MRVVVRPALNLVITDESRKVAIDPGQHGTGKERLSETHLEWIGTSPSGVACYA